MKFTVEFSGAEEVRLKFLTLSETVRKQLVKSMRDAMISLRAYVAANKLSGQVLHVRTGTLRRSITQRVIESGNDVTGIVGTNVKYAPPHEYGFKGTVSVREYLRRTKAGRDATVSAHSRKVDMPPRSFLRSSLEENRKSILDRLEKGVNEGIK